MTKRLYVGNLAWGVSSSELERLFSEHGSVQSAEVVNDRETGRSRGFGFVQMGSDAESDAAMNALNGADIQGRPLVVNEAREKEARPTGGGGGGGRDGRGGGYGRY